MTGLECTKKRLNEMAIINSSIKLILNRYIVANLVTVFRPGYLCKSAFHAVHIAINK